VSIAGNSKRSAVVSGLAALWAMALIAAFFRQRGRDLVRLPQLARSFCSHFGGFGGAALRDSLIGLLAAGAIVLCWYGIGSLIESLLDRLAPAPPPHPCWRSALNCAWGAGATSLLWFFLGLLHLYTRTAAVAALGVGGWLFVRAVLHNRHRRRGREPWTAFARALLLLTAIPLLLAAIASLAPPVAKDALLYHIALPKAFLALHALAGVPCNVAQYYALGAEMNGVWAMLLGRAVSLRAGEAAFGCTEFAYLPVLLLAVYGWLRRRGRSRSAALLPAALLACVPTMYASASSGYNDAALALYLALAVIFAAQWWRGLSFRDAAALGTALGFALQVKLLAIFLIVPLLVLFLFRLRQAEAAALRSGRPARKAGSTAMSAAKEGEGGFAGLQPGESQDSKPGALAPPATERSKHPLPAADSLAQALRSALLAVGVAVVLAAPWYVRNWARTGNPVFPFYMNILGGHAPGWDAPRSFLDQMLNARYGGYPKTPWDYLVVPFRASLAAQAEIPRDFDGVLGISFLFGLPLLWIAIRRRRLEPEEKIAAALAGAFFLFWLFSSEQLRYLLPALPALALALGASAACLGRRVRLLLAATAVPGILVIAAWFCRQAPLPVVVGAEPVSAYLKRKVDHYAMYEAANRTLPADALVWLINLRGDTYYLQRAYFYDFRIEDYTLVSWVRASGTMEELRDRVRRAGITHVLARTDVLCDYARSPVVDENRPPEENARKFEMLRSFLLQGAVLRREGPFVLVRVD